MKLERNAIFEIPTVFAWIFSDKHFPNNGIYRIMVQNWITLVSEFIDTYNKSNQLIYTNYLKRFL